MGSDIWQHIDPAVHEGYDEVDDKASFDACIADISTADELPHEALVIYDGKESLLNTL